MHPPDPAPHPASTPGPWGAGLTAVFGGSIFLVYSVIQGIVMIPLLVLEGIGRGKPMPTGPAEFPISGFNLALGTSIGCPVMLFLCALAVRLRGGPGLASYLAIRPIRFFPLLGWTIFMVGLSLGFSSLNDLLQRPPPSFVAQMYATAGHLPFLWCAIALCAPVAEEVLFRGFLFPGLLESRLRTHGTVLVTATVFMVVHAGQYEWIDLLQIGGVGLALGYARIASGTLLAPLGMHVALNLTSLILYALHLAG